MKMTEKFPILIPQKCAQINFKQRQWLNEIREQPLLESIEIIFTSIRT